MPLFAQQPGKRFAIALHGGAGSWSEELTSKELSKVEPSLAKALDLGVSVLSAGGSSLDAVEQVIRFLEDDPLFNAGVGAVFNSAGEHELDASIMDGRTKACGAVAGVKTVEHPISLARLVMEKSKHVLFIADGAEKFADQMRVKRVENKHFDTEHQRRDWNKARDPAKQRSQSKANTVNAAESSIAAQGSMPRSHYGTVGCVALDMTGNLAAGTSTGGLNNKTIGRVGDSPIIGAGTYADNATCAVSCTGYGEEYIRHAVAYDVSARVSYLKQPLKEAVSHVVRKTLKPGDGGIIAVGADGTIAMDFSTEGMARAAADWTGRREIKLNP
jgi:beta-aspartyl-peptidase (threonine type)